MAKFESKIHLITKLTTAVLKCPDCKTSGGVNDKGIVEWEKICAKHKEEYGKIHAKEPEKQTKFEEINKDVFVEIEPAPLDVSDQITPSKKKFSKDVKDFLWLQSRVLDKLATHPELYKVLDRMSFTEIWDRLVGKSGLEGVPAQLGGNLEMQATKETHKYFADLEKKLAKDGSKPYDLKDDEPAEVYGSRSWGRWGEDLTGDIFLPHISGKKPKQTDTIKEFDKDKEKSKLCKEHRGKCNLQTDYDYHSINCQFCLGAWNCPLWAKEGEKNAKKDV